MEKPSETSALSRFPRVHRVDKPTESEQDQTPFTFVPTIRDARREPRFKIEVHITIHTRTCGVLNGLTVDISESGIAAMLPIEASLGENVELNFKLPNGTVTIHAMVRQKNAFRYGFEFVYSGSMHELIRRTCRDLAIGQSPTFA